tara:strand:- start:771 stop:977 length:207 start_codon:yes stop_codon:yes gene_type:complete
MDTHLAGSRLLVKFSKGTVIKSPDGIGLVIAQIQASWGAERYKIMLSSGTVSYVWDKNMKTIEVLIEN